MEQHVGYELYEDKRDFIQEGLTGDVSRYAKEGMQFPCFVLCSTPQKYKLNMLRTMFKAHDRIRQTDEESVNNVVVYAKTKKKTVRMGVLMQQQVRPFLTLFEKDDVKGYFSRDVQLEGDMLYTLC